MTYLFLWNQKNKFLKFSLIKIYLEDIIEITWPTWSFILIWMVVSLNNKIALNYCWVILILLLIQTLKFPGTLIFTTFAQNKYKVNFIQIKSPIFIETEFNCFKWKVDASVYEFFILQTFNLKTSIISVWLKSYCFSVVKWQEVFFFSSKFKIFEVSKNQQIKIKISLLNELENVNIFVKYFLTFYFIRFLFD